MFSLGKNKENNDDQMQVVDSQLNQDLIVHNMPQATSGSSTAISPIQHSSGFFEADQPKKNFKVVGLVIIVIGLVFIGGIVYLTYHFIISPEVDNSRKVATTTPTNISTSSASTTPDTSLTIATSSILATTTPTVVELATSTVTSTATSTEQDNTSSIEAKPLVDTDGDGLTDEEESLLGTSATSTDTNENSYPDLVEINNNYNPIGTGRLSADSNLALYSNKTVGYDILYPKAWVKQVVNNEATAIFTAPDNSLIQVSVQDNSDKSTILSWYENTFPDVTVSYDKLKSNNNWEGIWGEDHLNFYLTDKKHANIYVISYTPAEDNREVYSNIFKLMINSLAIK